MDLSFTALSAAAAQQAISLGGTVSALPQALPGNVAAGAMASTQIQQNLTAVEKTVRAAALGTQIGPLQRTANVLGRALPMVAVGASAMLGAQVLQDHGPRGLVRTRVGRGAVLGAVGGGLLLVPTPPTQIAAAGVLAAAAVNQFGGMDRLNQTVVKSAESARTFRHLEPSPA